MLNFIKITPKNPNKALTLTLTFVALFLLLPGALAGNNFSAGPIYDQFPLTLGSGKQTEILGPLFYDQQNDSEKTWAFPPLFSRDADPVIETCEYDFLFPLFTYVKYGTQYRAQFFELFSFSGGQNPDGVEPHRITVFPVYFQQRSSTKEDDYTAVFPIYGHLKNHVFRDQIFFVMFPAYSKTQERDVVNYNYFWPFFNTHYGNGMHGWQFWPFYGSEHKTITTITNTWGVETNGGHDQYFVMWPVHFRQHNGIGTDNPEKFSADIPFYAVSRSPLRDSTSVLWPFFNWIDDRDRHYREWEMPWPIVEIARGPGKTANRVFPFFSHAYNNTFEDDFYLWPVYKFNSVHSPPLDRRRLRILFYLYQNTADKNTETGKIKRRVDLWPLFLYNHDFDGSTRFQVLALMETFFPITPGIERNWSPLWSIWRSENNPSTGAHSQSLLWNLYRRDTSPDAKKISFFFGFYQYQTNSETRVLRLFYIPVIKHHAP
jgi:hypothetical protein